MSKDKNIFAKNSFKIVVESRQKLKSSLGLFNSLNISINMTDVRLT